MNKVKRVINDDIKLFFISYKARKIRHLDNRYYIILISLNVAIRYYRRLLIVYNI